MCWDSIDFSTSIWYGSIPLDFGCELWTLWCANTIIALCPNPNHLCNMCGGKKKGEIGYPNGETHIYDIMINLKLNISCWNDQRLFPLGMISSSWGAIVFPLAGASSSSSSRPTKPTKVSKAWESSKTSPLYSYLLKNAGLGESWISIPVWCCFFHVFKHVEMFLSMYYLLTFHELHDPILGWFLSKGQGVHESCCKRIQSSGPWNERAMWPISWWEDEPQCLTWSTKWFSG